MRKISVPLLIIASFFIFTACTHPISKAARHGVDPSANLEIIKENPQLHIGKSLLLGGLIVGNKNDEQGSELEIYSYRLGLGGEPTSPRKNEGRFLARTNEFLDPVLFAPNRLVTLTGTIAGETTRELAGKDYRYPLLRIGEIHLWPEERLRSSDYYYYPYPFRPWPYYGPFYYDWYYRDYYRRRR
ncbi:MAG: hypothetical protein GXY54_05360 [Deltaproteobacteria bacterium]|nr:hypothetical protein [Deltaproteobacteria bacterium]